MARTDFQNVRTTAYTHSEDDHIQHGNRNALGGRLQAASRPSRSAASGRGPRAVKSKPAKRVGSAAADWSRWPAGTIFRVLSTGQTYKVEDYGWALAGRNTIDLYMATRKDMNTWGVRTEPIQILRWGSSEDSHRLLAPRGGHRHVRRMILQLEGRDGEAAGMQ
jgi:3D (Asp-Asp-Asp) domain-containing protein